MNRHIKNIFFAVVTLFFITTSCTTFYQPKTVQYKDYRLTNYYNKNATMLQAIQPYSDSVNKSMNDVIVVSEIELEKKQPESTLGNLMADAMLRMAKEKYKTDIDASFINFGGIRLNSIASGSITRGKLFELAPFDNVIVLLNINGTVFQEFINHITGRGGWPTAGASWKIKDKQAIDILVGGKSLEQNKIYTIALVDYVANGGDDCVMLKPIPQKNNGMLFRDALIEYLSRINKEGKKLNVDLEKRVTYEK